MEEAQHQSSSWKWYYSILSLIISVGVGFIFIGWQSFIIWGVLAVHELGHFFAQKKYGQTMPYPVFIPAIGAIMTDKPANPLVALAGPAIALPIVVIISLLVDQDIKTSMIILCIFHIVALTPILPFDGGWVTGNGWWSFLSVALIPLLLQQIIVGIVLFLALLLTWKKDLLTIDRQRKYVFLWIILYALWFALAYWAPWI